MKLIGTKTNRAALGAKIRVDLKIAGRTTRGRFTGPIGNNSSFGGNSLVETIGLLDAKRVDELDDLVADEPDDPDIPRHCRRPDDRDRRGLFLLQGAHATEALIPAFRSAADARPSKGLTPVPQNLVFCYNSERTLFPATVKA